jgi:hypothetical protein
MSILLEDSSSGLKVRAAVVVAEGTSSVPVREYYRTGRVENLCKKADSGNGIP